MLKRIIASIAVAGAVSFAALNVAEAAVVVNEDSVSNSVASSSQLTDVQFFFGGQNYCWYPDGWRGPGWYWCGYAWRTGYGWGGGYGWHGWRSPGGRRGFGHGDRHDFDNGGRPGVGHPMNGNRMNMGGAHVGGNAMRMGGMHMGGMHMGGHGGGGGMHMGGGGGHGGGGHGGGGGGARKP